MKFFLFFILSYSFFSQAELSSPLFLSQGGTGGASLQEDFSYLINPAVMGFQKKTKGALSYSFKQKQQTALISLLDLKTKFPMAITYQRFWSDSFKKSEADKIFLSSGFKVAPHMSIGFTVERELKKSLWNGGLGSIFKLGNQTSLALFVNQILKQKKKNNRVLSLAVYHNWQSFFSTKLDISRTAQKEWVFRGGLESLFQTFFAIRLGGTWFQKKQKGLISGGIAFYSPRLWLEYSAEKDEEIYQQAVVLIIRI